MYRYVPYVGTHIPENFSPIQVVFEKGVAGRGGAYGYIHICMHICVFADFDDEKDKGKERKQRKRLCMAR